MELVERATIQCCHFSHVYLFALKRFTVQNLLDLISLADVDEFEPIIFMDNIYSSAKLKNIYYLTLYKISSINFTLWSLWMICLRYLFRYLIFQTKSFTFLIRDYNWSKSYPDLSSKATCWCWNYVRHQGNTRFFPLVYISNILDCIFITVCSNTR